MSYLVNDLTTVIGDFQKRSGPTDRYTSFDYCYKYFSSSSGEEISNDIEKGCLAIGFYLASWGMLRGSSFLLEKSAKHYEPLVSYIAMVEKNVWEIDVDTYTEENIRNIISIYAEIKEIVIENGNSHLTLVTKIMLGVFGFIPAFDTYFGNTFRNLSAGKCGFRSVNRESLLAVKEFYEANAEEIDRLSNCTFVTDFDSGIRIDMCYKKAKIIDMYGFTVGLRNGRI